MSTDKKPILSVIPADESAASSADEEAFLFDEFFETPEAKTFPLPLKIAGRTVIIHIKKGLSNADRNAAEMAAVKIKPLPNGGVKFEGVDQSLMTEEMVVRAIVSWPFKHADGSPVPVNRETVRALKGGGEAILTAVNKFDQEGEAGLATFQENLSAAAAGEDAE